MQPAQPEKSHYKMSFDKNFIYLKVVIGGLVINN